MSTAIADTVIVTRRIKAPRERVFSAFATAEAVGQWFGCHPVTVLDCSVDFRVGGAYRIRISSPAHGEMVASGEYVEIVEPSRIAYTWKWEDDEDWDALRSLVTFEFGDLGDETEVRLTHTGFPGAGSRDNHTAGWNRCLRMLDSVLTGEPIPDSECAGSCGAA